MQFLKILGVGVISSVLSVGITSCGNDSEPSVDNHEKPEQLDGYAKRLTFAGVGTKSSADQFDFIYDWNSGNLDKMNISLRNPDDDLKWLVGNGVDVQCGENFVEISAGILNFVKEEYVLNEKGRVVKIINSKLKQTSTLEYNEGGFLTKITKKGEGTNYTTEFTWNSNRLEKLKETLHNETGRNIQDLVTELDFKYRSRKGYGAYVALWSYIGTPLCLANPEYFGMLYSEIPGYANVTQQYFETNQDQVDGKFGTTKIMLTGVQAYEKISLDEDKFLTGMNLHSKFEIESLRCNVDLNNDGKISAEEEAIKENQTQDMVEVVRCKWEPKK